MEESKKRIYPSEGDILLHKKGGYYKVLHNFVYNESLYKGLDEEFNPDSIVMVYQSLREDAHGEKQIWTRPSHEFTEDRFRIVIRAEDL